MSESTLPTESGEDFAERFRTLDHLTRREFIKEARIAKDAIDYDDLLEAGMLSIRS